MSAPLTSAAGPVAGGHLPSDGAPSDRVVVCPHAERCPGCEHVGVPYGAQLDAKKAVLAAALAPYAEHARLGVLPARGADAISAYRTRAKWVAGPGGARLGLYARGTHTVVDLPACAVASEVVASATAAVRALVRSAKCPAVSAALRAIDAREIVEASGDVRCLLTLVLVREQRPQRREITAAARLLMEAEPRLAGVSVNWAPAKAIQILGDETEVIAGEAELLDRQGDILVTATPGSFVQAHRGQAGAMSERIVQGAARLAQTTAGTSAARAGSPLRVLELFAGAAPFGLALACAGHQVTSIESFAPAAEGAARAARAQKLAITSLAEDATRATLRMARDGTAFDLVVVDPPRRGLAPALRAAIADLGPRAIAYVSCDPSTFARDLAHLAHLGYRTTQVEPWDFIPLSAHVEAFAWLETGEPPPLRLLARDGATAVVDAPPYLDPRRVASRAARDFGVADAPGPSWAGASGALLVGAPRAGAEARIAVAVQGKPRVDLRGPWSSLVVTRSSGGRSLVEIVAPLDALPNLGRALARAGHDVLGDAADAKAARHLVEKHGIDRPLAHVVAIVLRPSGQDGSTVQPPPRADIPGDVATALARLDLR